MRGTSGDFELTVDELRVVARFAAESAAEVLAVFEDAVPDDHRPRAALDAAWAFVHGAARSKLQRVTSLDAHRAAQQAPTEVSRLAAQAAGDAAAAAYLHPIAQPTQVGHILRASANVARIAEITADDPRAASASLERARQRASLILIGVLRRYPSPRPGKTRTSQLVAALDELLRSA